jgi:hypothetical protein
MVPVHLTCRARVSLSFLPYTSEVQGTMLYILVHTVTHGFEGMEELSTATVQYIHSYDN